MYVRVFKPFADVLVAGVLLILALPLLVLVAVLLAITQNGKVFFVQQRPGYRGRLFYLIKFKTMSDARDGEGALLPDYQRQTRLGNVLRQTSIDELPQLIQVLMGQLSLVGPRPLLAEYLPLYDDVQARRHSVRPGISGWAQVNGRNSISWEEKFTFDVWYVENVCFSLDFKIVLLTIKNILLFNQTKNSGAGGTEKFGGNRII